MQDTVQTLNELNQSVPIEGFNVTVLLVLLGIFAFLLIIVYVLLSAVEKSKIKKFTKPKKIYFKTNFTIKFLEGAMKNELIRKVIRALSNKLSTINSSSTASNDMKAFFLLIFTIIIAFSMYIAMVEVFGAKLWYLYLLYLVLIIAIIFILIKFYADTKEIAIAKQLPEALNDLKIAYDNRKRLKLAIQDAYVDMPRSIKKEFAKLAESDNLELSITELKERTGNTWFKMVLTLMELAVQKGDKEGALSEQLQMLNGVISQEVLIKESSRLMMQIYKIAVLCSPVFAVLMRNIIKTMGDEIAAYYASVDANNMMAIVILVSIILYFFLDMLENS